MLAITNTGAYAAFHTLNQVNRDLDAAQNRVSTGLSVTGALDDASSFSVAQDVRAEIKAWGAVTQSLKHGRGVVGVALAGATAISDLLGVIKEKVVGYYATDSARQAIVKEDIERLLRQLDSFAHNARFGGKNLINTDQSTLASTQPPDQGTTFTLNGPGSNTHALGTTAGEVQVNFDATGSGGGQFRLIYDGSTVASIAVNPPSASGSLTFTYGATGPTDFTVQRVGAPNVNLDYSFTLTPSQQGNVQGAYRVLRDIRGNAIDVQHRSLLAADIGLGNLNYDSVTFALGQIEAAEREVADALGYYGGKHREFEQAIASAERFSDANKEGLGNIVDADLARESARLAGLEAQQQLSLRVLANTNAMRRSLLGLFSPQEPSPKVVTSLYKAAPEPFRGTRFDTAA